jgi:hypothetical protein
MIDLQCNVHIAICVLYRVGSPGWNPLDPTKKTPISKNTKYDIEAKNLRYRIQTSNGHFSIPTFSSISGYNDIEVLNFDIDFSSILRWVDIDVLCFD